MTPRLAEVAGPGRDLGVVEVYHARFAVDTRSRIEWQDLTAPVGDAVHAVEISDGMVLINSHHTTTAVLLAEFRPPVLAALRDLIERLVPDRGYRHDDPRVSDCERGNGSAHLRAALLGRSVALGVARGRLVLGPEQSIVLVELDGPRPREISVQVLGWARA